jgi:D-aspartate ligase
MAKVYRVNTTKDLEYLFARTLTAGYDEGLIIQNFIPGDDTFMRVVTCYSDRNGKVKLTCTGHVLLEEHTPKGIGNHALIITEQIKELEEKLEALLEDVGFVGFSNFDVKYDMRDGKFKVFELNARQGRSNYYVTGTGENIARDLVEDYIYERSLEKVSVDKETLWAVVPIDIPKMYITQQKYKDDVQRLYKEGNYTHSLKNPKDKGLRQRAIVFKNQQGQYKKYSTNYGLKNRRKLFKGAPKGAIEENGVE